MDLNVMKLLLRRRGIADDPVGDVSPKPTELPEIDLTPAGLARSRAVSELPEIDLTPEGNSVAKLRDDAPDSEAAPASTPAEWSEPGQTPAPPLVQGDDEQRRQVWEYLKAKMAKEADPEGRERRRTANALLVAAGRNPSFEVEPKSGVSQELLQYLSLRNRDDAGERAAAQRAADSESRAQMAEQRFGLDSSTKQAELLLKQLEQARKARADEAGQPLRDAKVKESEARAGALAAKAKAGALSSAPGARDVSFDTGTLVFSRPNPDKQVRDDDQKKVHDKASAWGGLLDGSDKLVRDLEEMARNPSLDAQGKLRVDVAILAQGLTYAVGGGAMQAGEAERAEAALGVKLTNPNAIEGWLSAVMGNPNEAASALSLRARQLRPLAHGYVKSFAKSRGYDWVDGGQADSPAPRAASSPAPAAPPATPQDGSDKVPMISVASGKTVMLSPAAAAELEKSGKVRKP